MTWGSTWADTADRPRIILKAADGIPFEQARPQGSTVSIDGWIVSTGVSSEPDEDGTLVRTVTTTAFRLKMSDAGFATYEHHPMHGTEHESTDAADAAHYAAGLTGILVRTITATAAA